MTIARWLATSCLASALLACQAAGALVQARELGLMLADSGRQGDRGDDRRQNSRDGDRGDRRDRGDRDRGDRDRGDRDRGDRDRGDRDRGDRDRGDRDRGDRDRGERRDRDWGERRDHAPRQVFVPAHRRHVYTVLPGRTRYYRDIIIVRPHGRWYYGYGHYHRDNDAFRWLAFTAISLAILNILSESQQRAHEEAQIRATSAPIGEPIQWRDGGASGQVTALRDGYTPSGRYCREFQQSIIVGGRTEDAYGTACQQPDGSWQIVDDDAR